MLGYLPLYLRGLDWAPAVADGTLASFHAFTPALQKPEGFRDKASKGEVVVFYFEPLSIGNHRPA